jgi:hypothetical protein
VSCTSFFVAHGEFHSDAGLLWLISSHLADAAGLDSSKFVAVVSYDAGSDERSASMGE